MRLSHFTSASALVLGVAGFRGRNIYRRQLGGVGDPPLILVPSYNASVPVDHFNASDSRTFSNRFWVNDTFYKPGGPVIFYDFGESGVETVDAAMLLANWNGATSAPVELAEALNGVVIGWEHRYYGYSHPFPVNGSLDGSDASEDSVDFEGIPLGGVADYSYLTVEQALEDVVFFANNFNKTQLGHKNTVLGGPNATQQLGPYHTPWLWVGGSYPGNRGAWIRLRNPEVFYAVWASSAPVQTTPDGAAYFNSMYRGIPKNCSSDIQAAAKFVDNAFSGSSATTEEYVRAAVEVANEAGAAPEPMDMDSLDVYNVTELLFLQTLEYSQSYGISNTIQKLCDYMESFDVAQYTYNSNATSKNLEVRASAFLYNDGRGKPTSQGISASSTDSDVVFAAYLYGVVRFQNYLADLFQGQGVDGDAVSPFEDIHSWEWQVLSELGMVPNFNASSPLVLGGSGFNYTVARQQDVDYFASIPLSQIPDTPNNTFPASLGGWNMNPSNVMFTNGEFDPWRAFGLMSLDQDLGAPVRNVTQNIPKCGEAPAGTSVFGLLYGGAVHAEDIAFVPGNPRGSIAATHPVTQGTELFISAYNAWLPCFNASRTQANSGSSSGSGSGSGSGSSGGGGGKPNAAGRLGLPVSGWEALAFMAASTLYHLL